MQTHIQFDGLNQLFQNAVQQGRRFLFEYEVYRFIELIGGETVPQFSLAPTTSRLDSKQLQSLPGERVVIKVVSPYILHKSDVGGVRIVDKNVESVLSTIRRMSCEIPESMADQILRKPQEAPSPYRNLPLEPLKKAIAADIGGYILCQYMPPDSLEFGNELLVSLRNTREFGMVLSAGLGGRDTELYAARFRKGQAVVAASTEEVDGEAFFTLFTGTISYKKLAGLTRGQKRIVTDAQLLECFSALIQVARAYSPSNPQTPFVIEELEVNPFAFSNYLMMPLDGLCSFSENKHLRPDRPIQMIDRLLHPNSVAIAGISSRKTNIGRIILDNIRALNFGDQRLHLLHPDADQIAGLPTVKDLSGLPEKADLLILAVQAGVVPEMINQILDQDLAASVLLISGGLGEQQGQENLLAEIQEKINNSRRGREDGTVFLGGNSLGILSQPGRYDATFIPESKLPKIRGTHVRNTALVSQSGAYMITRMSKLAFLDPAYAISIGNQVDLTAGDFMRFLNQVTELTTIGFYLEGFQDLDGLAYVKAVRAAVHQGKEVIFYKAGRTPEGKNALSGHTASIAGDYMVCESCLSQAGAMVAETFSIFEGLLRLSCCLQKKEIRGSRLAAVSNAGYEAVGIADNILGEDYRLELAELDFDTREDLTELLTQAKISDLVAVQNPLDITPMAAEETYARALEILLHDEQVDAAIVAIVPLTPSLHTLPEEMLSANDFSSHDSIVERLAAINQASSKPVVVVVDSGELYDSMADAFQTRGLPTFRSADLAVTVLGKYIQNRRRMADLNGTF